MRGDEGRWCGASWATRRTLAFTLNKIEPQMGSEQETDVI